MTDTTSTRPASGGRRSRVRLNVFAAMWLLVLLNFVDRAALSVSLPFISEDFDISPQEQGWLLGVFFWSYLLCQVPGGWLLDRYGPRRVIGVAGVMWGGMQALGGFATSSVLLVLSRLGLGVFEAPASPAAAKLNGSWLPPQERARGATFVDMAGALGAAVGGVVVTGLLSLTGDWRWAFIITGAVTVLVAVLIYRSLRDTPEDHPRVDAAELAHIRSEQDPADDDAPLPRLGDYARSTSWWGLWFGRLGWATVWWGLIGWTPVYLSSELGFDLAALGGGTFLVYGCGVVGQLVSGAATDRLRSRLSSPNAAVKSVLAVSGAGQVVALLSLLATDSPAGALTALSAAVFFNQMGGVYWAFPAWLAPKRQVGTVGGVMNVASSAGGGAAPVVMGYAIAAAGGGFGGAFAFLVAAGVLYLAGSMVIDFSRPLAVARTAGAPSSTAGSR